jgi:hypothetical protein
MPGSQAPLDQAAHQPFANLRIERLEADRLRPLPDSACFRHLLGSFSMRGAG